MLRLKRDTSAVLTAIAVFSANAAFGGDLREAAVKTHPSQGDVKVVAEARSHLGASADGIFVNMDTSKLTPGHVHTLWLVTINEPAACESSPCTSKDVLKRTEIVKADVGYLDGVVVGADGSAQFNGFQHTGALQGAWFSDGLKSTEAVEVHLVINDHGPVIDGMVGEMLTTYRAGCTDESIPAPMPATARADGTPGPNACKLVQFSIFEPAEQNS